VVVLLIRWVKPLPGISLGQAIENLYASTPISCRSFTSSCQFNQTKSACRQLVESTHMHGVKSLLAALLRIHLVLVILVCSYVTCGVVNGVACEVSAN
jgi:hypothetical protein